MINVLNAEAEVEVRRELGRRQLPEGRRRRRPPGAAWASSPCASSRTPTRRPPRTCSRTTSPAPTSARTCRRPNVEYWLAPVRAHLGRRRLRRLPPGQGRGRQDGRFTYVLPNVRTWAEIDQKYLRPARDAALEGKKTPKLALDEVAPTGAEAARRSQQMSIAAATVESEQAAPQPPASDGSPRGASRTPRLVVPLRPADVRASSWCSRSSPWCRRSRCRCRTRRSSAGLGRPRELRHARARPGFQKGGRQHRPVHGDRRRGADQAGAVDRGAAPAAAGARRRSSTARCSICRW